MICATDITQVANFCKENGCTFSLFISNASPHAIVSLMWRIHGVVYKRDLALSLISIEHSQASDDSVLRNFLEESLTQFKILSAQDADTYEG